VARRLVTFLVRVMIPMSELWGYCDSNDPLGYITAVMLRLRR